MTLTSFVFTLSGSAQQLTGAVSAAKNLLIQADSANVAVVKVGSSTVSSSVYGILIPIPVSTIPAAPILILGPVQVDSVYVLGSNGEKLRVTYVD